MLAAVLRIMEDADGEWELYGLARILLIEVSLDIDTAVQTPLSPGESSASLLLLLLTSNV
jgi:hypothetical protein